MKDNFVICIESLHVADCGAQSNVSVIVRSDEIYAILTLSADVLFL